MYNTVKELHIALDQRLQQLNSNRKLVLYPEQKDARLNEAVLQFINNVVSAKTNIKKEGFEDTQKRYDDIEELIRTATLPIYVNESDNIIAPTPWDYLHLINDRTILSYNCKGTNYTSMVSTITNVAIIPFVDDVATSAPYYNSFKINIDGATIFTSPISTKSVEAKFMIINCALETLNIQGLYEIYWEYYLDHYEKNSFIIITPTLASTATITYGTTTTNGTTKFYSNSTYNPSQIFTNTIKKSNELCSHEDVYDMLGNFYYSKNRHLKPISEIQRGYIKVFHDNTFIIKEVQIDYIKRPRLINLTLNQSCELNSGEEIVAIAVQNILVDIKNDYTSFATERTIKE